VFNSARRVLEELPAEAATNSAGAAGADADADAGAVAGAGSSVAAGADANTPASKEPDEKRIRDAIELAWRNGDEWLRACAAACVRARPSLGIRLEPREDEAPLVLAELKTKRPVAGAANGGDATC
jgi:hypothetical protein